MISQKKSLLKNFKNVICFPEKVLFKRNLFHKSNFFSFSDFSNNRVSDRWNFEFSNSNFYLFYFFKEKMSIFLNNSFQTICCCVLHGEKRKKRFIKLFFWWFFKKERQFHDGKTEICEPNKNIRGLNSFCFLENCSHLRTYKNFLWNFSFCSKLFWTNFEQNWTNLS